MVSVTKKNDLAQSAIIEHYYFVRKETVMWFFALWFSIFILGYAVYQYYSVTIRIQTRAYIAVDRENNPLTPTSLLKPSPLSEEEIQDWMIDKIKYCMDFDYLNYALIYNECNTKFFTLNSFTGMTKGEVFYKALEKSGLISLMINNLSALSIEVMDVSYKSEGVREYKEIVTTPIGMETKVRKYYSYDYTVTFKINMVSQEVDAPIVYDVRVERMSELNREIGFALRYVISRKESTRSLNIDNIL